MESVSWTKNQGLKFISAGAPLTTSVLHWHNTTKISLEHIPIQQSRDSKCLFLARAKGRRKVLGATECTVTTIRKFFLVWMLTFQFFFSYSVFFQWRLIHIQNKHTGLKKSYVYIYSLHILTWAIISLISRSGMEVDRGRLFYPAFLIHLCKRFHIFLIASVQILFYIVVHRSLHPNMCHLCTRAPWILAEILKTQRHKYTYNMFCPSFPRAAHSILIIWLNTSLPRRELA